MLAASVRACIIAKILSPFIDSSVPQKNNVVKMPPTEQRQLGNNSTPFTIGTVELFL